MSENLKVLPELLAPAGSEEAFLAAISAGADAIYLGGKLFNARANAKNFDIETLERCIPIAHAHGVRVYVTINTLLLDRELEEAAQYAESLRRLGVDAFICADMGLLSILANQKESFPLDASTQVSLHSTKGILELADLPFRQVVVARELSKNNLKSCIDSQDRPIEYFLHGALCVCHSGQCLFSSLVGGRSGNRGECAQPCRLPYNEGYPLSLKDLSLCSHVTELIDLGVRSLKIEGRMKSPEYVYRVTKIYRRLLDERRNATKEEYKELEEIFSRSGFTDGYFTGIDRNMLGVRREEDKQRTRQQEELHLEPSKVPLTLQCKILKGQRVSLSCKDPFGHEVTVLGDVPEPARSAPLQVEDVRERLSKLGTTPYVATQIEVELDDGLNLSPKALNELRRSLIAELLGKTPTPQDLVFSWGKPYSFKGPMRSGLFYDVTVWNLLPEDLRAFFGISFIPSWKQEEATKPYNGIWLPPVILDDEEERVKTQLELAKERGVSYVLCGNPGQLQLARPYGFHLIGDFRLNVTNSKSAEYWFKHDVEDLILSPELTLPQMRDIGGRALVYGRIPLMLTERCYMKPEGGCSHCGETSLVDRKQVAFPMVRVPDHRNLILNSIPTYVGDLGALPKSIREHFMFYKESPKEIEKVVRAYLAKQPLGIPVRRFPK